MEDQIQLYRDVTAFHFGERQELLAQIEGLKAENRRLRAENKELDEQLASRVKRGRVIESQYIELQERFDALAGAAEKGVKDMTAKEVGGIIRTLEAVYWKKLYAEINQRLADG